VQQAPPKPIRLSIRDLLHVLQEEFVYLSPCPFGFSAIVPAIENIMYSASWLKRMIATDYKRASSADIRRRL